MHISIKTLNGRTHAFEVESSDTVEQLKAMILYKEGIPEVHQRLLFQGKTMEDGRVLLDYDVRDDAVLHCITRGWQARKKDVTEDESSLNEECKVRASRSPPTATSEVRWHAFSNALDKLQQAAEIDASDCDSDSSTQDLAACGSQCSTGDSASRTSESEFPRPVVIGCSKNERLDALPACTP